MKECPGVEYWGGNKECYVCLNPGYTRGNIPTWVPGYPPVVFSQGILYINLHKPNIMWGIFLK